ncbi:hypothetical protein RJ639_014049 [Escallonia herrerae]|uniref:Uncharacterized protein n=1 Tax=Escallonia herrerae TaxID=1293975 RepID=A0AA89AM82_9ASTE|nr:hypothetical protein RJ639_014049 [Escallonia herrerae]
MELESVHYSFPPKYVAKRTSGLICCQNGDTALHVLARKPSAFLSGNQLGIFARLSMVSALASSHQTITMFFSPIF